MGKATGFLEYQRDETPERSPLERIRDFDEFHGALSEEERRKQGARCMNCGRPILPIRYDAARHGDRMPAAQSDPRMER